MISRLRFLAPLLALSLFGLGCQVGPRITRVPEAPAAAPIVPSDAIAYVKLNGGSAQVSRGGETQEAVENTELASGDRVVVTMGTVSLVYPDAGISHLEKGSDVTLVSDSKDGEIFTEARLTAGDMWTRFERLLGVDEHFSVASNGVVATVRGTAFGVSVIGSDVDVQVADHQVQVEQESTDGKAHASVSVAAGEGLRVGVSQIATLDATKLRAIVRTLSGTERAKAGFVFGTRSLLPVQLQKPESPVRLFRTTTTLPVQLESRLQVLRQTVLQNAQFAAPTRSLLPTDAAPTSVTPSVNGPTGQ